MGRQGKWKSCEHFWGPEHGLRYPNLVKYGTLAVCVRCRARRYTNFETGVTVINPPVPLREFSHNVGKEMA